MVKNNIHGATELHTAVEEGRKEGQADLAAFVLSCTKKTLNDLLKSSWEMQNTKSFLVKHVSLQKHSECRC